MVLLQGMSQLAVGLSIGFLCSLGLAQILEALLVGVKPTDPATLAVVAVVLMLAGLIGSVIPARRAIEVDPIVALRTE